MANPNPSPETRFKPGQSGNPGGRSPKLRDDLITRRTLEMLMAPHPSQPGKTRLDVMVEKWLGRTEAGDGFSELLDRVDGKLPEKTEASVNVTSNQPTDDPELDGWAKQRAKAIADKEGHSSEEPSGLRGPDIEGPMGVDTPSGPTE